MGTILFILKKVSFKLYVSGMVNSIGTVLSFLKS